MPCAPVGIRTPNLLIRSQMLYPLSYGRQSRGWPQDWSRIADPPEHEPNRAGRPGDYAPAIPPSRSRDGVPHPRRTVLRPARLPVRAALPDPGRRAADALRGRRPAGRSAGPDAPRRTDVELPLPAHGPVVRRRGVPRPRARPGRLRQVGQAGEAVRAQLRPARRLGPRVGRGARPPRDHARVPGLGVADRAAPGRRDGRPVRTGGRRQRLPAHGGAPRGDRVPGVAGVRPEHAGLPGGPDRRHRDQAQADQGRAGGVRRALPDPGVAGRAPGDARTWCRSGTTTRRPRPTGWPGRRSACGPARS